MPDMKFFQRLKLICLVLTAALLCLPPLTASVTLLHGWYRLKTQPVVYFDYPYVLGGLAWCLVTLLAISPLVYSLLKRTRLVSTSLLAIVIGLVATTVLPEFAPEVKMNLRATRLLGHADQSLAHWDDLHGRFPKDDTELREALNGRPLSEAPIFYSNARGLAYTVKLIPNATKAYDAYLPDQPGIFAYAVRDDFQEYWLTMTTLTEPVGGPAVFYRLPGSNGQLWVMNRTHRNDGKPQRGFIE